VAAVAALPRSRPSRRLLAGLAAAAIAIAAAAAGVVAGSGPDPPQVVAISVRPAAGPAEEATGVVLGPGRVLTVAHVLAGAGRVAVRGPDGALRRASVLRSDPDLDLAVLEVRGIGGSPPSVADAATSARILVARGGEVRPLRATIRRRITARLVDQAGRPRRPSLELAAQVRSGDSGAPVVSRDGRIVGIVYARSSRRAGTAYAVRGPGLRRLVCGAC
jgi:S1-C subfamily serine protease